MFNLWHAHGAQRKLLQVRQLCEYKRLLIEPNSWMVSMGDQLPQRKQVGRLADEDMVWLNRALLVFLGIAAPTENEEPRSR
jgi:hypothetical protein